MPHFSKKSQAKLDTCHNDLRKVFARVIQHVDCTVLEGHRSKELQDKYYSEGKSKVKFPNGRHNQTPSMAVDVAPYPIDWTDRERFHLFAGFVLGVATAMGVKLRWGGDWDKDWEVNDNRFDDFPHFELIRQDKND